jgi:hypothetical protein
MLISAQAELLHVVGHGVLPEVSSHQFTLMLRGPLAGSKRDGFHETIVVAANTTTAYRALQQTSPFPIFCDVLSYIKSF